MSLGEAKFISIDGIFYRSVVESYRHDVLSGSRSAGRYSSPTEKTLYMSSSEEGAIVAVEPTLRPEDPPRVIVKLQVQAEGIFDLRDENACAWAGINKADALQSWKKALDEKKTPSSWFVASKIKSLGANGLIDPSRRRPNLWHLVLFNWNTACSPKVKIID